MATHESTAAHGAAGAIKGISLEREAGAGASALRVAIVHAKWNKTIIDALVGGAISELKALGVTDANIDVIPVRREGSRSSAGGGSGSAEIVRNSRWNRRKCASVAASRLLWFL
jgi:hypothetical protein